MASSQVLCLFSWGAPVLVWRFLRNCGETAPIIFHLSEVSHDMLRKLESPSLRLHQLVLRDFRKLILCHGNVFRNKKHHCFGGFQKKPRLFKVVATQIAPAFFFGRNNLGRATATKYNSVPTSPAQMIRSSRALIRRDRH